VKEVPEKIELRPATPQDSEFAYTLKKAALGEYVARIWGWDETFQREFHEREFNPEGTEIILRDGRHVGLARIEREADHIYVRHLYIVPEAQNQGIGSHIVQEVLKEASKKKVPVRLHVLKVNEPAVTFYEKHGFRVVGETRTHYRMETPA
jgi:ribosomal protein S18 acetylase RimI-like enzyme